MKSASLSTLVAATILAVFCIPAGAQTSDQTTGNTTSPATGQNSTTTGSRPKPNPQPQSGPSPYTYSRQPTGGRDQQTVNAGRQPPSSNEGHGVETYPGHTPHGSNDGPAIAAGATAAGLIIGQLIAQHEASPNNLGKNGPQVPKELDMNGFTIKGLVQPNWPIVLDFVLDSPGAAQVDIITADKKHHYRALMTNRANYRAYAIFRLPPDFGKGPQIAVYQIQAVAAPGSTAVPRLRTFGLGAGDKAVGSVAIDQLSFQPPMIHPKAKELANYGFHAHSAFDGVRAEFVYTTLYNGHLLIEMDQEQKLPPIPEGERGRGTWAGKGKPGQHMFQVRAWRGLENGGDWVVAWSPDIVDVVQ
jgi:hypothetical protein